MTLAMQPPEEALEQQIGKIAAIIGSEGFPTGERAALRRMTPGRSLPLPFYRFAVSHLPAGWERSAEDWATLVTGIALMSPNAYDARTKLGKALKQAEYSELRLERLLMAEDETRRVLFLRAIRSLAAKSMAFNWADGARFLLTRDEDKRERVNLDIARAFYSGN